MGGSNPELPESPPESRSSTMTMAIAAAATIASTNGHARLTIFLTIATPSRAARFRSRTLQFLKSAEHRFGGVESADAVSAGAGWGRGGADEEAGGAGPVRDGGEAGADRRLPGGVGAGEDVAADEVGVAGLELGRRRRHLGDDPLAEAGREAFDLVEDRLAGVAAVAARHVCVGPEGVQVAARAARVGEVLLADEDVGTVGHAAAVDLSLGGDDLLERADRVNAAGAAGRLEAPGHPALDREVELEGARPISVAAVGAGDAPRQPVAGQLQNAARGEVEDDRVGRRQLVEGAHPPAGLDPAAVLADHR